LRVCSEACSHQCARVGKADGMGRLRYHRATGVQLCARMRRILRPPGAQDRELDCTMAGGGICGFLSIASPFARGRSSALYLECSNVAASLPRSCMCYACDSAEDTRAMADDWVARGRRCAVVDGPADP